MKNTTSKDYLQVFIGKQLLIDTLIIIINKIIIKFYAN